VVEVGAGASAGFEDAAVGAAGRDASKRADRFAV
jgi:hypothetical protein